MKHLRDGLGVLVLAAIVLRVLAWLVTPAIPLIVVLFVLVAMLVRMLGGPSRLS